MGKDSQMKVSLAKHVLRKQIILPVGKYHCLRSCVIEPTDTYHKTALLDITLMPDSMSSHSALYSDAPC